MNPRSGLANLLRAQSAWCTRLGSPFYASLLARAADDCESGGPVWTVLQGHESDPVGSALGLRFMGSVHRLVLEGQGRNLGGFYDGSRDGDAWPAFSATVEENIDGLRSLIQRPVQTNEVARSCSLVGGFATIARETGLPLSIREIGSCAGLLLLWDHYRYEGRKMSFGPQDSPVSFNQPFEAAEPRLDTDIEVVDRAGCDRNPVDPTTKDGALTLTSFVWPDLRHRLTNLSGALKIASEHPVTIEKADAVSWLEGRLGHRTPDAATVVFHSITMQYLEPEHQKDLRALLSGAGRRATARSPLAWLRFEPKHLDTGAGPFLVTLTLWPGGEERVVASSHAHGPPVNWFGEQEMVPGSRTEDA